MLVLKIPGNILSWKLLFTHMVRSFRIFGMISLRVLFEIPFWPVDVFPESDFTVFFTSSSVTASNWKVSSGCLLFFK